jgi:hypothetical protein
MENFVMKLKSSLQILLILDPPAPKRSGDHQYKPNRKVLTALHTNDEIIKFTYKQNVITTRTQPSHEIVKLVQGQNIGLLLTVRLILIFYFN